MRLQGFNRAGWAGAAAVAVGCSGSHAESKVSPVHGGAQVGEIHAQLRVGGESIGHLNWTITPPTAVAAKVTGALSGTVSVASSGVAAWTLTDLPAARGYELTVAATANDGDYVCASSTTFDVAAEMVSQATMTLACRPLALEASTGSISFDVATTVSSQCTGLTSVSASPYSGANLCESADGVIWSDMMQLVATAIDSAGDTTDQYVAYSWTVSPNIGTFDNATSPTPVFTCTTEVTGFPAEMTVATSAPGAATCGGSAVVTFPVNCLPPPCGPNSSTCDCHICTNLKTDSANCGNCGNVCPNGSVCSQGVCVAGDAGTDAGTDAG
jgi:hypothetical protein